jgi:hypothetical protein
VKPSESVRITDESGPTAWHPSLRVQGCPVALLLALLLLVSIGLTGPIYALRACARARPRVKVRTDLGAGQVLVAVAAGY